MMKAREMFQLALKVVGFVILLQGLRDGVESIMIVTGYAKVRLTTPGYWAGWAIIKMVVGTYLLVGVTPFAVLAFPRKSGATNGATEPTPSPDKAEAIKDHGRLMNPIVMFDLIVRTVGLIVLLYGLQYVFDQLLYAMETVGSREASNRNWTVLGIGQIVVGLAMLRGLVPLVSFAFPGEAAKGQPDVDAGARKMEPPIR